MGLSHRNSNALIARIFCILIAGVAASFISLGCSRQTRYEVLTFFFTGVPPLEETEAPAEQAAPSEAATQQIASAKTENAESRLPLVKHAPFEAGECDACHEVARANQLFTTPEKLCFRCHGDFAREYAWVHGPVAVGFCNTCHAPHESRNQSLLLSTSFELCLKCHQEEDVFSQPYHEISTDTTCTQCHDPHGSEDRWLLRKNGDAPRTRLPERDETPPAMKTENLNRQNPTSQPNPRSNTAPGV